MSRYSTLLEASTPPAIRVVRKTAVTASVVPAERLQSANAAMTATPIATTPSFAPGPTPSAAPSSQQTNITGDLPDPLAGDPENDPSHIRSNQLLNERTIERRMQPRFERTKERTKVRHTFDILTGQLLCLREIVISREKTFGKRVLLGDLVQEALDMFIAREQNNE